MTMTIHGIRAPRRAAPAGEGPAENGACRRSGAGPGTPASQTDRQTPEYLHLTSVLVQV